MVKYSECVYSIMSEIDRDESGRFTGKVSEQDILKAFDNADAPFLTAPELSTELGISRQAVTYRLDRMHDSGLVGRKKTGSRSVGWWAKYAPKLAPEVADRLSTPEEAAISHEDLKAELGVE